MFIYEVSASKFTSQEDQQGRERETLEEILVFQKEELHYCLVRSKHREWEKGRDYKGYEINENKCLWDKRQLSSQGNGKTPIIICTRLFVSFIVACIRNKGVIATRRVPLADRSVNICT